MEVSVEQTVYQTVLLCRCSSKGVQIYFRFRFSTFYIDVSVVWSSNILQSPLFKFITVVYIVPIVLLLRLQKGPNTIAARFESRVRQGYRILPYFMMLKSVYLITLSKKTNFENFRNPEKGQ